MLSDARRSFFLFLARAHAKIRAKIGWKNDAHKKIILGKVNFKEVHAEIERLGLKGKERDEYAYNNTHFTIDKAALNKVKSIVSSL